MFSTFKTPIGHKMILGSVQLKPAVAKGLVVAPLQPFRRHVARPLSVRIQAQANSTATREAGHQYWAINYDISKDRAYVPTNWKQPIKIAVSGAAGSIANHLLFQLCSGEVFGPDQPIILQLLGSERSFEALQGVVMELEDSLYPLLRSVELGTDCNTVFADADWAILLGAKPRGPGMERADLLEANGRIFEDQGKILDRVAKKSVKVIVVGNPCNTNALIAMANAPSIPRKNFHALTRLDENRAKAQLAIQAQCHHNSITGMAIWGNHSTTQVPDFVNAKIGGKPATDIVKDRKWLEETFVPTVAGRGGALIKKWGKSSAASTAVSICDAIRSLVRPTPPGDFFSTGVISDGNPYGVQDGLIFSFPCRSKGDGDYEIVSDLIIDDWLRAKIRKSEEELVKERECTASMIPNANIVPKCDLKDEMAVRLDTMGER